MESIMKVLSLFLMLTLVSCQAEPSQTLDLSESEKESIKSQITQRVEDYYEAVTNNKIEEILNFWSDSEEFIHAGDGSILGGYQEWSSWLKEWNNPARDWLYWNNEDIHVIVLDKNIATYTMNFENAYVENMDTSRTTGAWTFVFRKDEETWKVIASNGTHKGFSY